MYQILEKNSKEVLIKMDIETFEIMEKEIKEDINQYEFVFNEPVKASKLINI